jgi:hypothetical protein
MLDCFIFGYRTGFHLHNTYLPTLVGSGADNFAQNAGNGTVGLLTTGTIARGVFLGCSFDQMQSAVVTQAVGDHRFVACAFGANGNCNYLLDAQTGSYGSVLGCNFGGGLAYAACNIRAGAQGWTVQGCTFDGQTTNTTVAVDPSAIATYSASGNRVVNSVRTDPYPNWHSGGEMTLTGSEIPGSSVLLQLLNTDKSGVATSPNTVSVVAGGAAGDVQAELAMGTYGAGLFSFRLRGTERLRLLDDGGGMSHLLPGAGQSVALGTAAQPFAQAVVSGVVQQGVATSLVAAGTNASSALALGAAWNVVTGVPAGAGVMLPAAVGAETVVINAGASPLVVYPPAGAAIGTSAMDSIQPGGRGRYLCATATQFFLVG